MNFKIIGKVLKSLHCVHVNWQRSKHFLHSLTIGNIITSIDTKKQVGLGLNIGWVCEADRGRGGGDIPKYTMTGFYPEYLNHGL